MLCCSKWTDNVGRIDERRPRSIFLPGVGFDDAFSNVLINRSWDLIYHLWLVRSFHSLLCNSIISFVWIAKWNELADCLHHKDVSWRTQACSLIWERAKLWNRPGCRVGSHQERECTVTSLRKPVNRAIILCFAHCVQDMDSNIKPGTAVEDSCKGISRRLFAGNVIS